MAAASERQVELAWSEMVPLSGPQPPPRYGQATCLVQGDFLVLWGGLGEAETEAEASFFIFRVSTRVWREGHASGEAPLARWGATMSIHPRDPWSIVLLGGRAGSKPMPLSEPFVLNLRTMAWTRESIASVELARRENPSVWSGKLPIHGTGVSGVPKNRYGHTALSVPSRGQILVFGGHGGRTRYFGDVSVLQFAGTPQADLDIRRTREGTGFVSVEPWERLPGAGTDPDGGAEAGVAGRSGIAEATGALGAAGAAEAAGPAASDGPAWLPIECRGSPPPRRSGHAMVHVGRRVVVCGGYTGKAILEDVWSLDLDTFTWSQHELRGQPLPPLMGHSATPCGDGTSFVVFGGRTHRTTLSAMTFKVDLGLMTCENVTPALSPPARFLHAALPLRDGLHLVLGGIGSGGTVFDGICMPSEEPAPTLPVRRGGLGIDWVDGHSESALSPPTSTSEGTRTSGSMLADARASHGPVFSGPPSDGSEVRVKRRKRGKRGGRLAKARHSASVGDPRAGFGAMPRLGARYSGGSAHAAPASAAHHHTHAPPVAFVSGMSAMPGVAAASRIPSLPAFGGRALSTAPSTGPSDVGALTYTLIRMPALVTNAEGQREVVHVDAMVPVAPAGARPAPPMAPPRPVFAPAPPTAVEGASWGPPPPGPLPFPSGLRDQDQPAPTIRRGPAADRGGLGLDGPPAEPASPTVDEDAGATISASVALDALT